MERDREDELRTNALRLACGAIQQSSESAMSVAYVTPAPETVVARAAAYFAFLKGEDKTDGS